MGTDLTVQVEVAGYEEVQRRMKGLEDKTPQVMRNAINKTITQVKKLMSDEARKEYIVKAGEVKKTIRVKKANLSDISGSAISSSLDHIKLIGFRVSPTKPQPASPPRFYKTQVKQLSRLKELTGSKDRSSAFVAKMDTGHVGVFQRQKGVQRKSGRRPGRKEDEAIAELVAMSIPRMLGTEELSERVLDKGAEILQQVLDAEIDRMLEANT